MRKDGQGLTLGQEIVLRKALTPTDFKTDQNSSKETKP